VSEKSLRDGTNHGFLVPAKAVWCTTGSLALEPMQERLRAEANGEYWFEVERQNENSRSRRNVIYLTQRTSLNRLSPNGHRLKPAKRLSLRQESSLNRSARTQLSTENQGDRLKINLTVYAELPSVLRRNSAVIETIVRFTA
jgi:hypothetical protein